MDEIIVLQFLFIHVYYSLFHRFLNRILYVIYQVNVQTFLDDSPRQDFQFCLFVIDKNQRYVAIIITSYRERSIVLFKMNLFQNKNHYNVC